MKKKLLALLLLFLGVCSSSFADCSDAFRQCRNECNSVSMLINLEGGDAINALESDFYSNCEDACRRGKRYCEGEATLTDGCYAFKRACRNDCPDSLLSFRSGSLLLLTNANDQCEDACNAGYRRCE
jgi:hypothetical protein